MSGTSGTTPQRRYGQVGQSNAQRHGQQGTHKGDDRRLEYQYRSDLGPGRSHQTHQRQLPASTRQRGPDHGGQYRQGDDGGDQGEAVDQGAQRTESYAVGRLGGGDQCLGGLRPGTGQLGIELLDHGVFIGLRIKRHTDFVGSVCSGEGLRQFGCDHRVIGTLVVESTTGVHGADDGELPVACLVGGHGHLIAETYTGGFHGVGHQRHLVGGVRIASLGEVLPAEVVGGQRLDGGRGDRSIDPQSGLGATDTVRCRDAVDSGNRVDVLLTQSLGPGGTLRALGTLRPLTFLVVLATLGSLGSGTGRVRGITADHQVRSLVTHLGTAVDALLESVAEHGGSDEEGAAEHDGHQQRDGAVPRPEFMADKSQRGWSTQI